MLIVVSNIQPARTEPEDTIKAVVLDSWGADYSVFTIYPRLNNKWSEYGSIPIVIDFTSLNKEDITYNDLALTEADVLIISHAIHQPEHVFTDTEIAAIKQYVEEGHGIIGTYGTLMAENNHKLAVLFGMNQSTNYVFYPSGEISTGIFDILDMTHPLFVSLPNPFTVPTASETIYVPSHDWTVEGVTDGSIVALTTDNEAAIISRITSYKSIYFTNQMEEKEPGMPERSFQVFYNAIVWAGMPDIGPLQAFLNIDPGTLNLRSKGRWITTYIELPEGYDVNDIDVSTILLNETIPSELHPISIGDYDDDGVPDLMVKFDRAVVIAYISSIVNMTQLTEDKSMTIALQVSGELTNGTPFYGSDTITTLYTRRGIGIGQILFAR